MHTPGPWKVGGASGNGGEARVIVSNSRCIAWTACSYDEDDGDVVTNEDDANACLIAAAPELLWAANVALSMLGGDESGPDDDEMHDVWVRLRAAVTKATGKEVPNG